MWRSLGLCPSGSAVLRTAEEQVVYLHCIVVVTVGQHVRDHLARGGIHAEVQLHPAPAGTAVLGRTPLTSPEQLQPGAVQH